jgi:hypothetical protein
MKYELIISCQKGTTIPEWTPGMDRLAWWSPYPDNRELLEELIAAGDLSRYVEHDDRVEETETEVLFHTIYNTLEGATRVQTLKQDLPVVNSATIIERPDL